MGAGLVGGLGFGRDRSFAPTILIVIASYYVLFALMGASQRTVVVERIITTAFLIVAVVGFKKNLWLVVAAIVGHGIFDLAHDLFIDNPGVPNWWPGFSLAFGFLIGYGSQC